VVIWGKCILVGPLEYCNRARDILIEHGHGPKSVEIRHRLPTDVIEMPEEMHHIKAQIGA
jgi:hypothetical protein